MNRAKDGIGASILILTLFAAGCGSKPELPYRDFLSTSGAARTSISPGFQTLLEAATLAETKAAKYISRTNFTAGKKEAAIELCAPAIQLAEQATNSALVFEYEPSPPFTKKSARSGWNLIGQTLVWRIEKAVRNEEYDAAVTYCINASRFGAALTGGDCSDAAQGFAIIDQARKAAIPAMTHMSSAQLSRLSAGMANLLETLPSAEQTLENERQSMLLAVNSLQSDFRDNNLKRYETELRNEVFPAIKYLNALDKSSPERAAFFDSLAEEADTIVRSSKAKSKLNARQRSLVVALKFDKNRPWRRWSKQFFQAPTYYFPIRDRTLARTRLFAIELNLIANHLKLGSYPKTLDSFPASLRTDPFCGKNFAYFPSEGAFKIYSFGADFRDDGGDTNESFASPDLTIETNL